MKPDIPPIARTAFSATLFCILPLPIGAQAIVQPQPQPTYPIRRVSPTAFPELPKNLSAELKRRGCTIPQPYTDGKENVIHGEFAKPGQTDWAVLCSTRGSTSLLFFWNGKTTNPLVLDKSPDNPHRTFDWFIRPVDRKSIIDHYRAYGGPKPPPIDHQGIESGGEHVSVFLLLPGQVVDAARSGLIVGIQKLFVMPSMRQPGTPRLDSEMWDHSSEARNRLT